jgi:hypothetical protein
LTSFKKENYNIQNFPKNKKKEEKKKIYKKENWNKT